MAPRLARPTLMVVVSLSVLAGFAAWQALRAQGEDPVGDVSTRQTTPVAGDDPVAVVNGEPIPATALRNRLLQQEVAAAQGLPTASPAQIMDALVDERLLQQEARRRGLECTEAQLRDFVSFHLGNLRASDREWLSTTYGVPVEELEESPTIARLYSGSCSRVQVRRAIAAERSDLPPEEAVQEFLSELRSRSEVQIREQEMNRIVEDAASVR